MSPDDRVYRYRDAINGFFEFPTDTARAILPSDLQPVEPRHGSSILAVTGFEFVDSPVGVYRELALSIVTSPRLTAGAPMPRASMYPFMVGTTTEASRRHGIEVWHLPHWDGDLGIDFDRSDSGIRMTVRAANAQVLELALTQVPNVGWENVEHQYQTFMTDAGHLLMSPLTMTGAFMEHEEERGSLRLERHPLLAAFDPLDVSETPFREQWMKDGIETIHPLQTLSALAGR
jgi:hypothetical protein